MLKLTDREWKAFEIGKLFDILSGIGSQKDTISGNIPFVGATANNNGLTAFVKTTNQSSDQNLLGVNFNGSVGETFYHPYKCVFSADVKRLHLKEVEETAYICLFLKTAILQQQAKYMYGYKFNGKRMQRQQILLPTTSTGSPDWQFMEDYMREREQAILRPVIEKLRNQLKNSKIANREGQNREWKVFALKNVFSIKATQSGIDKIKLLPTVGGIPYLTRTEKDNGIGTFIGLQNDCYQMDEGNVLIVGLDTQSCFYQSKAFYTGQNIQVFKNSHLNQYNAMYLIPLIKQVLKSFNWGGNGATLTRLKRSNILLPVTSAGTPDWQYMEDYMRHREAEQLRHYLAYITKRYTL